MGLLKSLLGWVGERCKGEQDEKKVEALQGNSVSVCVCVSVGLVVNVNVC